MVTYTLIKASGTTITLEDIGVRVCVCERSVCAGVGMCVYVWVRAFLCSCVRICVCLCVEGVLFCGPCVTHVLYVCSYKCSVAG